MAIVTDETGAVEGGRGYLPRVDLTTLSARMVARVRAFTASVLIAGCAAQEAPILAPDGLFAARPARGGDSCPLTIEGVRADIETTGLGVAVNLTAPPDQVMLLRARAKDSAVQNGGLLAACPCTPGDPPATPAADIGVEDVEGGSRLSVTAKDPADAHALAKLVRTQLTRVHGGDCARQ